MVVQNFGPEERCIMVYEKMANSRNQGHVIFRAGKFEKYI